MNADVSQDCVLYVVSFTYKVIEDPSIRCYANDSTDIPVALIFLEKTSLTSATDWLWVRSPLEEMKYLFKFIFPFLRSGVEVKRGVEFCHSTRNASRIRQKVGNGVS